MKKRHFAGWSINEEAIMRSFCAGLASSTLGVRRGLGEEEKAEAERKRKREDSLDGLDIVPPSPELWGAAGGGGGGGGGGGYRDSRGSNASSSSSSSPPPPSRSRRAGGGGGGGGLSYRAPAPSRRSGYGYGDDGPPDFEFETNEQVSIRRGGRAMCSEGGREGVSVIPHAIRMYLCM